VATLGRGAQRRYKKLFDAASVVEKRGPQNEGKFHDLIENKWRKNVCLFVLHDLNENKVVMGFAPRC
jgi:hypothetical protein